MAITCKQNLYGQLLVDFVNATSTEQAGLKYFENVQKVFGFSYRFTDQAKAAFPVLGNFLVPLSEPEKRCCGFISEIKKIEERIDYAFFDNIKYDIYSKTFHRPDRNVHEDEEPTVRELSIEEMKAMLQTYYRHLDSKQINNEILLSHLPKLLALGEQILSIEGISKERYKQISEIEAAYDDAQKEHSHIAGIQNVLNSLLHDVVKTEHKGDNKVINEILQRYNNRNKLSEQPTTTTAIDKKKFNEADFFSRNDCGYDWYQIYNQPVDYCVNEFLGAIKNIEYLKKCERCGKFYIANKLIEKQKRCSICSKKTRKSPQEMADYMKKYRHQKKSMKEIQIKKHIEKGHTRKEAEALLKMRKLTKTP